MFVSFPLASLLLLLHLSLPSSSSCSSYCFLTLPLFSSSFVSFWHKLVSLVQLYTLDAQHFKFGISWLIVLGVIKVVAAVGFKYPTAATTFTIGKVIILGY